MFDSIRQDVVYALRVIRLNPAFSAVAILSLALGGGANTAMFQLLDAVRLRTLPVREPHRLVELRLDDMTHARGAWLREGALTNPLWEQIRNTRDVFSGSIAWADETLDVSTGGEIRKIGGLWVSGDFFRVLGVQPVVGRLFTAHDDRRGCGYETGVVLSYRFWQQELGGDPAVAGRQISIGKVRTVVVGVTPPSFFGLEVGRTFDVAMPICAEPAWHGVNARLDSGTVWWLTVVARLAANVSVDQAAARMRAKSAEIFEATLPPGYPAASVKPYLNMKLVVAPAAHGVSRLRVLYSRPLAVLLAITGLVLLIACVNLAHLMLARASARKRELAVRLSLGASGRRLAQQLITESFVLAVGGVAVGLLLARSLSGLLVSFVATEGTNIFLDLSVNFRTFTFATILAIATCLLFAAIPACRAAGTEPAGHLRRGLSVTSGREHSRIRRVLLASQIALSLALLVGTLLFVRSLRNLRAVDPGFRPDGITIVDVNFSDLQLPSDRAVAFRVEMLDRIRAIPGVAGAAEGLILPLSGGNWNNRVWMEGSDPEHARVVMRNMIGPEYFHALNTPLVAGRDFNEHDLATSAPRVAIVNEKFVQQFGLENGIGERFSVEATPLEPRASYEIVAVVANTKYRDLREDDQPIAYVPLWQAALRRPAGQFVIRSNVRPDTLVAALRTTLDRMGKVRYSFRPYTRLVEDSLLRERLMATLAGPFGTLAIVLTAVGLYGMFSYIVAQRTNEIGIRIALGASRRDVVVPIFREALAVVSVGLSIGLLLTFATSRAAETLLFEMKPYDPVSLSVASVSLVLVAVVASYLPARRAANVDPLIALRRE